MMEETKASLKPVIENLEHVFSLLNDMYFDDKLEKPVITVSPDNTKCGAYGWCTSWRVWQTENVDVNASTKTGYYEINICADHLSRSFREIAETMLHEMVHLYDLQIGVKDTSRGGTYHNAKFKEAAEKHGLICEKTDKYGWSKTSLNPDAQVYVAMIHNDIFEGYEFGIHRMGENAPTIKMKKKSSSRKYVCPMCGMIIRATKPVNIRCMDCYMDLEEVFS